MNESPADAPTGWSPWKIGGIVAGGILLLVLLIPTFRPPDRVSDDPENPGGPGVSRAQCDRTLESALEGMQPLRLGLSSEERVMVDTLNNWLTQCMSGAPTVAAEEDAELRRRLLTTEGFERSSAERYQLRDAEHIRNSLLARAIVERVTLDQRTDRQRALELFYYVVRTVDLLPPGGPDFLLTPYESLVFGIGSAADRAWVYALLLRQLRLDCVMLQPRLSDGASPYWLIGVVIPDDGVLLFDPRLGLPIAADPEGESPLPSEVATLREVQENNDLLRQYDRQDLTYPLSADDLETVDVFAIGTSSTFAPRMGRLQAEMSEPVELYDGLASSLLYEKGLVERLVAAGEGGLWEPGQVRIWPYPEMHWGDTRDLSEAEQQLVEGRYDVIRGPYTITAKEDEQGNVIPNIEKPRTSLHEARINQLLGNFPEAQQVYLRSRLALQDFQSVALREVQLNAFASDMATYWAAQSQFEQQDYSLAAESAATYLQRGGGNFIIPAAYLASVSAARDGRPAEAAALLAQEPPQVAQYLGDQTLVDRWRRIAGANGEAESPGGKPADSETEGGAQTPPPDDSPTGPSEASGKSNENDAKDDAARPDDASDDDSTRADGSAEP